MVLPLFHDFHIGIEALAISVVELVYVGICDFANDKGLLAAMGNQTCLFIRLTKN